MQLSKKGWNNVLIFGILLSIVIFKFSSPLGRNIGVSTTTVIAPDLTILEIQTPDYTITRMGREWQREPSLGLSNEKLQQIVNSWQTIPLASLTEQQLPPASFSLSFYVAEQQKPIIVQLHQQQNDHYILQVNEDLYLSLPAEKLTLFIGK